MSPQDMYYQQNLDRNWIFSTIMKSNQSSSVIKIIHVVGTRPNFMKAAPIMKEISKYPENFIQLLVHTGQHYDEAMSDYFFNDLELPRPDIYLGAGPGTHGQQTGKIMIEFEKICFQEKPNLVIVVGDVNSTLACALVAAKVTVPVAHVEAGLRSYDRTMPEEINRVLTDQVSEFLFTTCEDANHNLLKEGLPQSRIFFVGNTMIDTLYRHWNMAKKSIILENLGLKENDRVKNYALVTLHRPSNVDHPRVLNSILSALNRLARQLPIIFPVHPRTLKQLKRFNLSGKIHFEEKLHSDHKNGIDHNVRAMSPLGYHDFLCLMSRAAVVLTDSGGIQEEATILGVPCLTLRRNTERPITVRVGTNILVGHDPDRILSSAFDVLKNGKQKRKIPQYWDGKAAGRIVEVLLANKKRLQSIPFCPVNSSTC